MKVLVAVKLTVDISQLKFESDGEPLIEAAPKKMGDADKCAVEEAVRLKEKNGARVAAVTVGSTPDHIRVIRDALAMGADEGYVIKVDNAERLDALSVGELIAFMAARTGPYDLILLGAGSGDTHSSTLGPIIASLLGTPIIAGADALEFREDEVRARCMMEDGSYTYRAKPPLVVTVTSEANEPRIPTLKAILRSKRMEVKELTPSELDAEGKEVKVGDVKRHVIPRKREIWEAGEDLEEAAGRLIEALRKEGVI